MKCPHCEQKNDRPAVSQVSSGGYVVLVVMCPSCDKVIGTDAVEAKPGAGEVQVSRFRILG